MSDEYITFFILQEWQINVGEEAYAQTTLRSKY
jgi:hypothetical protein